MIRKLSSVFNLIFRKLFDFWLLVMPAFKHPTTTQLTNVRRVGAIFAFISTGGGSNDCLEPV
jgi:hypothetical protein